LVVILICPDDISLTSNFLKQSLEHWGRVTGEKDPALT